MGLTSFKGADVTLEDVRIAKNYLSEKELKNSANIPGFSIFNLSINFIISNFVSLKLLKS